jgi:hypothetical protein
LNADRAPQLKAVVRFHSQQLGAAMPTKKRPVNPTKRATEVAAFAVLSPATSWADFLSQVRAAREDLGNPSVVWYRGHSRAYYKLVPSLLRNPIWAAKEQILFDEYERSASRLLDKRQNDWELLIDMQHYGIPTRLLDWTDVLGISLAFAYTTAMTITKTRWSTSWTQLN